MRIATWNINGLRARIEFVRAWLAERRPDVVGLQELKLTEDRFPHAEFESLGYQAVLYGQKAWNGVAILSRETARVTQCGLPGEEEFGSRLITAEVAGLSFTTVYCPNGKDLEHPDFRRKLKWFESLRRHLDACHSAEASVVLCGDFNVCPAPIDSWHEEPTEARMFHTRAERDAFARLLQWGLVDVFRQHFPDRQAFTWWDYRAGAFHKKRGLRLDFLLATQPVAARVRSVEIDRDYRKKMGGLTPSDHAPVVADLAD